MILASIEVWQERIKTFLPMLPFLKQGYIKLLNIIIVGNIQCRCYRHQFIDKEILDSWLLHFVSQHLYQLHRLAPIQLLLPASEPYRLQVLHQKGYLH